MSAKQGLQLQAVRAWSRLFPGLCVTCVADSEGRELAVLCVCPVRTAPPPCWCVHPTVCPRPCESPFACSFKKAVEKGEVDEQEQKRQHARQSLERYMHYWQRWAENDSSRKKVQCGAALRACTLQDARVSADGLLTRVQSGGPADIRLKQ